MTPAKQNRTRTIEVATGIGVVLIVALAATCYRHVTEYRTKKQLAAQCAPYLATAHAARDKGQWTDEAANAQKVLSIDPGNEEAAHLRQEATWQIAKARWETALAAVNDGPTFLKKYGGVSWQTTSRQAMTGATNPNTEKGRMSYEQAVMALAKTVFDATANREAERRLTEEYSDAKRNWEQRVQRIPGGIEYMDKYGDETWETLKRDTARAEQEGTNLREAIVTYQKATAGLEETEKKAQANEEKERVQTAERERRKKVEANLTAAREAQTREDWKTAKAQALEALALDLTNQEANDLYTTAKQKQEEALAAQEAARRKVIEDQERQKCPRCHTTGKCWACNGRATWPQTRTVKGKLCPICHGSGWGGVNGPCGYCGGRKEDPRNASYTVNEMVVCSICGGNGKCPLCHGTGKNPNP